MSKSKKTAHARGKAPTGEERTLPAGERPVSTVDKPRPTAEKALTFAGKAASAAGKAVSHGVRNLWRRLADNLKEWGVYLRSRRGKKQPLRQRMKQGVIHLKRDMRHQVNANRHRQFPESEYGVIQLLLFAAGSVPMLGSHIREAFHFRRKQRIHRRGAVRSNLEQIRLHPVAFLGGALAIAAVCALLSLYTVGVNVSYDNYLLGTASGRGTVRKAVSHIEQITRQTLHDDAYTVDTSALTMKTRVVPRRVLNTREELEAALTDQLGQVEYANVLYVNNSRIAASVHDGAIEELLQQLKIGYVTADTVDCYLQESTEVRREYVPASYVMNLGYIAQLLNATKEAEVTYTVKKGDTPVGIAESQGVSLDDLKAINPGYDWKVLRVGDELTVSKAVSYLTVVNVERQDYVQDVPYEVEYQDDDSMYQGDYKLVSKGEYGKADVSANVTYVNGEEISRQVVATATLRRPVTEQQLRGTKERPSWYPTGSFAWPCNGVLTSRFGPRNTGIRGASSYHEGIDIANGYGTPIYASDGGTVSHAGWMGGYGYLVIIDHNNGYQTYYAHNSSLLVSVGDHVYKGEQVARMGSTGVSSGCHCDFRIKLNGTFLNPLNFLP